MDFDQKLQKAIDRGLRRGEDEALAEAARGLSEEEYRSLHSRYRLQMCEHIEACVRRLLHHFPGFEFETIYGQRGWGAACKRDDVRMLGRGRRTNLYSRLELTVRPYSSLHVLELNAKGTVHNRELLARQHYQPLDAVDPTAFLELIDAWVLEFAELYSSKT